MMDALVDIVIPVAVLALLAFAVWFHGSDEKDYRACQRDPDCVAAFGGR